MMSNHPDDDNKKRLREVPDERHRLSSLTGQVNMSNESGRKSRLDSFNDRQGRSCVFARLSSAQQRRRENGTPHKTENLDEVDDLDLFVSRRLRYKRENNAAPEEVRATGKYNPPSEEEVSLRKCPAKTNCCAKSPQKVPVETSSTELSPLNGPDISTLRNAWLSSITSEHDVSKTSTHDRTEYVGYRQQIRDRVSEKPTQQPTGPLFLPGPIDTPADPDCSKWEMELESQSTFHLWEEPFSYYSGMSNGPHGQLDLDPSSRLLDTMGQEPGPRYTDGQPYLAGLPTPSHRVWEEVSPRQHVDLGYQPSFFPLDIGKRVIKTETQDTKQNMPSHQGAAHQGGISDSGGKRFERMSVCTQKCLRNDTGNSKRDDQNPYSDMIRKGNRSYNLDLKDTITTARHWQRELPVGRSDRNAVKDQEAERKCGMSTRPLGQHMVKQDGEKGFPRHTGSDCTAETRAQSKNERLRSTEIPKPPRQMKTGHVSLNPTLAANYTPRRRKSDALLPSKRQEQTPNTLSGCRVRNSRPRKPAPSVLEPVMFEPMTPSNSLAGFDTLSQDSDSPSRQPNKIDDTDVSQAQPPQRQNFSRQLILCVRRHWSSLKYKLKLFNCCAVSIVCQTRSE